MGTNIINGVEKATVQNIEVAVDSGTDARVVFTEGGVEMGSVWWDEGPIPMLTIRNGNQAGFNTIGKFYSDGRIILDNTNGRVVMDAAGDVAIDNSLTVTGNKVTSFIAGQTSDSSASNAAPSANPPWPDLGNVVYKGAIAFGTQDSNWNIRRDSTGTYDLQLPSGRSRANTYMTFTPLNTTTVFLSGQFGLSSTEFRIRLRTDAGGGVDAEWAFAAFAIG